MAEPIRMYSLFPARLGIGKKHTLILSYDGELYACGCNAEGGAG